MRQVTCDPKRLLIEIGVGTVAGEVRKPGVGTAVGEVRISDVGTASGEVRKPGVGTGEVRNPGVGTVAVRYATRERQVCDQPSFFF